MPLGISGMSRVNLILTEAYLIPGQDYLVLGALYLIPKQDI